MDDCQTVCIVRGSSQKAYLESFVESHYPTSRVHIIDSEATPSFRDAVKALVLL